MTVLKVLDILTITFYFLHDFNYSNCYLQSTIGLRHIGPFSLEQTPEAIIYMILTKVITI